MWKNQLINAYNRILLRNSKEHIINICNNIDESPMHCTKCKKAPPPKKKILILYTSWQWQFGKVKTARDRKPINSCQVLRVKGSDCLKGG